MKKICFAILVHNYKEALKDMVDNIRHFCPHSSIVLYNGEMTLNYVKVLAYQFVLPAKS